MFLNIFNKKKRDLRKIISAYKKKIKKIKKDERKLLLIKSFNIDIKNMDINNYKLFNKI